MIDMSGKMIDLTGQRFGKLTVIKEAGREKKGVVWLCQCDCGNTKTVRSDHLRSGDVTSCGCGRMKDMTGMKFGNLTVIEDVGRTNNGDILWLCQCDCGNTTKVSGHNLRTGNSKTCGNRTYHRVRMEMEAEKLSARNKDTINGTDTVQKGEPVDEEKDGI